MNSLSKSYKEIELDTNNGKNMEAMETNIKNLFELIKNHPNNSWGTAGIECYKLFSDKSERNGMGRKMLLIQASKEPNGKYMISIQGRERAEFEDVERFHKLLEEAF